MRVDTTVCNALIHLIHSVHFINWYRSLIENVVIDYSQFASVQDTAN